MESPVVAPVELDCGYLEAEMRKLFRANPRVVQLLLSPTDQNVFLVLNKLLGCDSVMGAFKRYITRLAQAEQARLSASVSSQRSSSHSSQLRATQEKARGMGQRSGTSIVKQ